MKKSLLLLAVVALITGCATKPYPWESYLDEMEKEVAPNAATTQKFNAYLQAYVPKMQFYYSVKNKLWVAVAPESPFEDSWKKLNNRVFSSRDGEHFIQESSRSRALNIDTALPYFMESKIGDNFADYELFYCSNAYSDEHRELVLHKAEPKAFSFTLIGFDDEFEYEAIDAPPKVHFKPMPVTMVKRNLLMRPNSNQYFLMAQRKYGFHPLLMEVLGLEGYQLLSGPPDSLYPFHADCISIEGKYFEDSIKYRIKCALGELVADEKADSYQWTEYGKTIDLTKIQPYNYFLKPNGQYTEIGWVE